MRSRREIEQIIDQRLDQIAQEIANSRAEVNGFQQKLKEALAILSEHAPIS
jgi:hypothetical protein